MKQDKSLKQILLDIEWKLGRYFNPLANLAAFPAVGNVNHLYVANDTGNMYRWTGTAYATVGGGGTPTSLVNGIYHVDLDASGNLVITASSGVIKGGNAYANVSNGGGGSLNWNDGTWINHFLVYDQFQRMNSANYGTILNAAVTGKFRFFEDFPSFGSASFGTGADAVASAVVEIGATSVPRGFLPPRMTTAQRTGIASPAEGLIVYDTDLHHPFYMSNTAWVQI